MNVKKVNPAKKRHSETEASHVPVHPVPVSSLDDPDMRSVPASLYQAARRAHLIAYQTGTGVIVRRDGKVVEIPPDPRMYEGLLRGVAAPTTRYPRNRSHVSNPSEECLEQANTDD